METSGHIEDRALHEALGLRVEGTEDSIVGAGRTESENEPVEVLNDPSQF